MKLRQGRSPLSTSGSSSWKMVVQHGYKRRLSTTRKNFSCSISSTIINAQWKYIEKFWKTLFYAFFTSWAIAMFLDRLFGLLLKNDMMILFPGYLSGFRICSENFKAHRNILDLVSVAYFSSTLYILSTAVYAYISACFAYCVSY